MRLINKEILVNSKQRGLAILRAAGQEMWAAG